MIRLGSTMLTSNCKTISRFIAKNHDLDQISGQFRLSSLIGQALASALTVMGLAKLSWAKLLKVAEPESVSSMPN